MSKKPYCPFCDSPNIRPWALGKLKCRGCGRIFKKAEAVTKDYVPRTTRSPRKMSQSQERRTARQVKGRPTVASGSTPNRREKGDVRADDLRVECKFTGKKSFSLKKEELDKIAGEAQGDEMPVFAVEFRSEKGRDEYYIVPKGWFLELLEAWRRDRDD